MNAAQPPASRGSNPVWIIDDDRSIRWVFEKALAREGIEHRTFSAAQEALDTLDSERPQVVVSDIRMPGLSGLEFMQRLKEKLPSTPVIIMTAYSDLESAVAAFQGGAFEYLPKPFDVDHAVELVRRALDESRRQVESIPTEDAAPEILGQAPAMQEVFRAIGRLAQSHATVLITGESGTGKELVARALHRHSPRAPKAFIAINTAAIPKELLESELFGHERGAFTGAQTMRRGRFEQAEGGTLFLDEIGDMPPDLQTRLLRVLSDGQFYRVGGHTPLAANVRVIAATHQDLETRVKQGLFREDLYHRLNVIRLRLPALRERREDIPALARHFLAKSARELGVDGKRLTDTALQFLTAQEWAGNVRQIENLCHWVTVMAPGQVVDVNDLPPEVRGEVGAAASEESDWRRVLEREVASRLARGESDIADPLTRDFETVLIVKALQHTGGRRIEAAGLLGIGRNTLTRKVQELKIDTKD
ncbi:MAG TPA: nitrogen regulation protein NR(I) [Usitatibacter sp.]|jgi:two-component system, NtrC family, nitrogen regulation response regulator GlnG|nr:nitrogen regulation protein NR(I) [Usitatibacter sp.]